jgi:hypothetical protein
MTSWRIARVSEGSVTLHSSGVKLSVRATAQEIANLVHFHRTAPYKTICANNQRFYASAFRK